VAGLVALGADRPSSTLLERAVTELVAKAVEHAYAATTPGEVTPGEVTVSADLAVDGRARVTVADHGRWKPPSSGRAGGRGLPLVHLMVPDTVVSHDDQGTTVRLAHRLSRAAHIVADPQVAAPPPVAGQSDVFEIDVGDAGHVVVSGDVDSLAAPILAASRGNGSHAGSVAVRGDLGRATHLGSAALSVLADACARAERQNTRCALVAPPRLGRHTTCCR